MIDGTDNIPIVKQCELLELSRASYYYEAVPESEMNLRVMQIIDKQYLMTPFYGSRRMAQVLKNQGEITNRKRVQRLMRVMGIEAMYPKPKTSAGNKEHYKYPYLLKNMDICRPNQAWGTDITYVPTEFGYLYLVAILDLFSRYVVSWRLSDNLESDFCVEAVEQALERVGKPEILNSDQGVQYTSKAYIGLLKKNKIAISMSGKGRCWDNIFVERLWRSFKYEEVYLKGYATGEEAQDGTDWYFNFYNNDRIHEKLGYTTPHKIHYGLQGVI